jgi:UDP-N-acetylmuramate: L-alanyl-gamma-D-glutamyl-meso-diaminopimelate ligase
VLEFAGLKPGFLVGGVPENFGVSARLGEEPYFVIEADEYDSAFFDKRSKFVHYHPRTLILNNLEFDHADIFADLAAIQTQFHHLVRIVPEQGCIIRPEHDANLQVVIDRGCWTPQVLIGEQGWSAISERDDNSQFSVFYQQALQTKVTWNLIGEHNVANALAVFAATQQIGIPADLTAQALASFKNVKRRLEVKGTINGITVYDDFAHHPTAIQLTLQGLRHKVGQDRIIAIIDLGSYTMRSGAHKNTLLPAIAAADQVYFYKEHPDWHIFGETTVPWTEYADTTSLIADLKKNTQKNDHIVVMSNRGFVSILQAIES